MAEWKKEIETRCTEQYEKRAIKKQTKNKLAKNNQLLKTRHLYKY